MGLTRRGVARESRGARTLKLRSQLQAGKWPETLPSRKSVELAPAAKRQAEEAIAELQGHGVTVALDDGGRVRFKSAKTPPVQVRLLIERLADVVEAFLVECRA